MALELTNEQKKAVTNDGHNILVSAAAGSGKTRVLVERVINKITKKNTNIDDLLILTFTRAAANEIRQRIQDSLEQLRQEALNRKQFDSEKLLEEQLDRLNLSEIGTLDSFCLNLVKQYYYVLDIDPEFKQLTNESEVNLLQDQLWEELSEDLYKDKYDINFRLLVNNFSSDRGDNELKEIVITLMNNALINPDPNKWLDNCLNIYDLKENLWETNLIKDNVLPYIKSVIKQLNSELATAFSLLKSINNEKLLNKWQLLLNSINEQVGLLKNQLVNSKNTWNQVRTFLQNLHIDSAPRSNSNLLEDDKVIHDQLKKIKQTISDLITSNIFNKFFILNEQDVIYVSNKCFSLLKDLLKVVKVFISKYQELKKKQNVYDFNDIEHLALELLKKNVSIAKRLQEKFTEIMIDEYQDTNSLQEEIVSEISKKHSNLFMVGDVKQSIYRFRLANPDMFLDKYNSYSRKDNVNERITLSNNFRSMRKVDDFVNLIFGQLMDHNLGDIDYDENNELKYGSHDYPDDGLKQEILIYQNKSIDDVDEDKQNLFIDNQQNQILMVIDKIKTLIKNKMQIYDRKKGIYRNIEYRDIALLVPTKNNNLLIQNNFIQNKIPINIFDTLNYFQTVEIQIMVSMLKIIDNPYQDIPLVTVLRSPMYQLNENELAYIRLQNKDIDYFTAVKTFINNDNLPNNDFVKKLRFKINHFMQQLLAFKNSSNHVKLSELIWKIYQDTGFLDYVMGMPGGEEREANLHALYERASEYENNNFRGLYQFINFINDMNKNEEDFSSINTNSNNAVSVMTIHSSKGLEFPVVFLMNANHKFNLVNGNVIDQDMGLGISYLDQSLQLKIDSLQKQIIFDHERKKELSEQMRVLYVALTRAEQRLFIVGQYDDKKAMINSWQRALNNSDQIINLSLRLSPKQFSAPSFMDWIGIGLVRTENVIKLMQLDDQQISYKIDDKNKNTCFDICFYTANDLLNSDNLILEKNSKGNVLSKILKNSDEVQKEDINLVNKHLSFVYSHQKATENYSYAIASKLDSNETQLNQIIKNDINDFKIPKFVSINSEPSASEIGTATHLVLEKIDLNKEITETTIQNLLNDLVNNDMISSAVSLKVNVDNIIKFFKTDLGLSIINNRNTLYREKPFAFLKQFDDDYQVYRGIIDGFFEQDDNFVLFDYKTNYISNDKDIKEFTDKYRKQLNIYSEALESMYDKKVSHKYLCFLDKVSIQEII